MSRSKQSIGVVVGLVAGLALAALAGQWMSEAEAQVPAVGAPAQASAIEISEGSIALVLGPGGQYFVIDRQGNGFPVRFREQDLTMPVGSALLKAP